MKYLIPFFCFFYQITFSQTYTIDARITPKEIMAGHLKMGNPGPAGKEILLNNKYITIGGKPVVLVMGEVHFTRVIKEQWEDIILKMKANGINIIATYVFWIHHEEVEGQFDWSGNKDLRSFIKLCHKHGLYVYPRIGPWCHGEVRNGGSPDWVFSKKDIGDRSNHPVYQFYADRLYKNIALQLQGLYYKDGGPIIGIQLENEYRRGPGGNAHILWLKQTAQKYGMDVPMYTVTGWGNASVPQDEVIPLFGGYPEEPWVTNIEKAKANENFTFEAPMNDEGIGADVAGREGKSATDHTRYPYLTCEVGVGNQISYHRRPILNKYDGLAIATAKTGSGGNLPGYYVFAGGSNHTGLYYTMEENQDETGYWNEYPDISYDFQAAVKETGELAPSYHQVKKFHYFLKEFGDRLAPMLPVIPKDQKPKENLQWAVRVKENQGFVFGMNYYRGVNKLLQKGVQFNITLPSETFTFPSKPLDIADSAIFIWPFNFEMGEIVLKYATAQPLCHIDAATGSEWFFIQNLGVTPELCLDASKIASVETKIGKVTQQNNTYLISGIKPGFAEPILVKTKSGKEIKITVLSYKESDMVWFFSENNQKHLLVSDANLYMKGNELFIYGYNPSINFYSLAGSGFVDNNAFKVTKSGRFDKYSVTLPEKKVIINTQKREILDNSIWLKNTVPSISSKNLLNHKIFTKEFDLINPAAIKSATLYFYSDIPGKLRVNRNWLNQEIKSQQINQLDLTGYLQKGYNVLLADFPFVQGEGAFAAKLEVEYFNSDKIEIHTDGSWLTTETYVIPATWTVARNAKAPEVVPSKKIDYSVLKTSKTQWVVTIPDGFLSGLNNVYLYANYTGDIGRCRLGHRLVSDNYYNGTTWQIQLKQFGTQVEGKELIFEVFPLKPGYKIAFDVEPKIENLGFINMDIKVLLEYSVNFEIKK